MPSEIITTDDLREFKTELFSELKKLLDERQGQPTKKWLKSFEVRKMLVFLPEPFKTCVSTEPSRLPKWAESFSMTPMKSRKSWNPTNKKTALVLLPGDELHPAFERIF